MLGSPQAESGRELLARLAPRPDLTTVLSELWSKHPVPGDIIEITGPAGVGKTQLLLDCVSAALSCDTTSEVIFIDADRHARLPRLLQFLQRHLGSAAAAGSAISRLQLLTPSNSHQILVTLETLLSRLAERAGSLMLAIDSLSTFYWSDRHGLSVVGERADARCRELGSRLVRLATERRLVVVATRGRLSTAAGSSWDFMGAEWAAAVTRTVRLTPAGEAAGAAGLVSASAEAGEDRWQRQLVIDEEGIRWL